MVKRLVKKTRRVKSYRRNHAGFKYPIKDLKCWINIQKLYHTVFFYTKKIFWYYQEISHNF